MSTTRLNKFLIIIFSLFFMTGIASAKQKKDYTKQLHDIKKQCFAFIQGKIDFPDELENLGFEKKIKSKKRRVYKYDTSWRGKGVRLEASIGKKRRYCETTFVLDVRESNAMRLPFLTSLEDEGFKMSPRGRGAFEVIKGDEKYFLSARMIARGVLETRMTTWWPKAKRVKPTEPKSLFNTPHGT